MLGGGRGVAGLVSLTSPYPPPYSSELFVPGGWLVCLQGFTMCACVGLAHFGFLWEREQVCEM